MYNSEFSIDRVKNVGKRSYSASTYYNVSAGRPNFAAFLGTQVSPGSGQLARSSTGNPAVSRQPELPHDRRRGSISTPRTKRE